ncbi:lysylphosphatidylglycerol synthase transmembrane domain-containing protein [Natrononativus amylolyticus]|uniref:lysylphosphatidylglycerol synthase transmembrane domain-containing protein n=1 Tax=Natrononativus amylolyticus TaxID=2963434 RepID=UPI0020CBAE4B|nr:lysylphosphatidylglycerol synthase transmembrane domain-containing protein [Natrononativus amylolyticus]
MKRRAVLGFALAAVFLAILANAIGSEEIVSELAEANYRVLALGLLAGTLALTFRGLVWVTFLGLVDESMPRGRIGLVFLTAMFAKYVTPYGQVATEPFVAYLVARESEMAYEDGLAGIISADLLNYLPYYSFGFLGLLWIGASGVVGDGMVTQVVAFAALFSVVATLLYVAVRHPSAVYRLILAATSAVRKTGGGFSSRLESSLSEASVNRRLDGFYDTVDTIAADRRRLAAGVVYAHVGMAFLMSPVYIAASALGYELSLAVVAVVVALGKLGAVVPAPGGTGGVEAVVTAGLTTLGGLEWAAAFTVALIYRLCTYWLTIGIGGVCALALTARE